MKNRLQKFKGIKPKYFYLYLKGKEFRFNLRKSNLYNEFLNEFRIKPL